MAKAHVLHIPFSWIERRPLFLERFFYLPFGSEPATFDAPFSWRDLFGNDHPVKVEYCSGNGQWIGNKAKLHPEVNWVAVEKKFERARKIWALLKRESLPNLYVLCGEAVTLTRCYFPEQSLSSIYVNFPDPWPKQRQGKHRLFSPSFLTLLERVLLPEHEAIVATDDPLYMQQIIELFQAQGHWQSDLPHPHFTTHWPDFGRSFFQELFEAKGHIPHYTRWVFAP